MEGHARRGFVIEACCRSSCDARVCQDLGTEFAFPNPLANVPRILVNVSIEMELAEGLEPPTL